MSDNIINNSVTNAPAYKVVDATGPTGESNPIKQPVYGGKPLLRVGFISPIPARHAASIDYVHDIRPLYWPYYHPFYLTAVNEDHYVVMAYVESEEALLYAWPEAEQITVFESGVTEYTFNDRFPKPDWLDQVNDPSVKPIVHTGCFSIVDKESEVSWNCATEDMDYQINLAMHQLEYGRFSVEEIQENYETPDSVGIIIRPTHTLEEAERLKERLDDFHIDHGEIPTELPIE